MEYFLGSIITLVSVGFANKLITKRISENKTTTIRYSQSHVHMLTNSFFDGMMKKRLSINRQSTRYQEESYTRIVVAEEMAYWITNNIFYTAEMVDGTVDRNTSKEVDAMKMDNSELKKMMVIVEALREGTSNDSGNPGQS